jgi:hypothetical protein
MHLRQHGNRMSSKERNLCLLFDITAHASCTLLDSVTLLLCRCSFFNSLSCSLSHDNSFSLFLSLSLASSQPRCIFVLLSLCNSLALSLLSPSLCRLLRLSQALSLCLHSSMPSSFYPSFYLSLFITSSRSRRFLPKAQPKLGSDPWFRAESLAQACYPSRRLHVARNMSRCLSALGISSCAKSMGLFRVLSFHAWPSCTSRGACRALSSMRVHLARNSTWTNQAGRLRWAFSCHRMKRF